MDAGSALSMLTSLHGRRLRRHLTSERPDNLVLDIPANGHETKSRNEYCTNLLAFLALDRIPPAAAALCNSVVSLRM